MVQSRLFEVRKGDPMKFSFTPSDKTLTFEQKLETEDLIKQNGGLIGNDLYVDPMTIRLATNSYQSIDNEEVFDVRFVYACIASEKIQNLTNYLVGRSKHSEATTCRLTEHLCGHKDRCLILQDNSGDEFDKEIIPKIKEAIKNSYNIEI